MKLDRNWHGRVKKKSQYKREGGGLSRFSYDPYLEIQFSLKCCNYHNRTIVFFIEFKDLLQDFPCNNPDFSPNPTPAASTAIYTKTSSSFLFTLSGLKSVLYSRFTCDLSYLNFHKDGDPKTESNYQNVITD